MRWPFKYGSDQSKSGLADSLPPQLWWDPRGAERRGEDARVGRVLREKVGRKYGAPDENETNDLTLQSCWQVERFRMQIFPKSERDEAGHINEICIKVLVKIAS